MAALAPMPRASIDRHDGERRTPAASRAARVARHTRDPRATDSCLALLDARGNGVAMLRPQHVQRLEHRENRASPAGRRTSKGLYQTREWSITGLHQIGQWSGDCSPPGVFRDTRPTSVGRVPLNEHGGPARLIFPCSDDARGLYGMVGSCQQDRLHVVHKTADCEMAKRERRPRYPVSAAPSSSPPDATGCRSEEPWRIHVSDWPLSFSTGERKGRVD